MEISMSVNMDHVNMDRQKRKGKVESSIILVTKNAGKPLKQISYRSTANDDFRSAADDGIDCGTKMCYLEYRVLADCNLILETNNTNCKIPCLIEGCDTELHHFILCPVWNCELITTTTSSTTTSFTTTTSSTSTTFRPRPDPNPSQMSAFIYTSIVFNIFFFALVCAYVVVKCRAKISARFSRTNPRARLPRTDVQDPNYGFSLGENPNDDFDNEREPLLSSGAVAHGSIMVESSLAIVNANAIGSNLSIANANARDLELAIENQNQTQDLELAILTPSTWDSISLAPSASESQAKSASNSKIDPTASMEPLQPQNNLFQFMKKKAKK
jgi:hypothetical protein